MPETEHPTNVSQDQPSIKPSIKKHSVSKKVSDHLANERTFLAWIRTGLATITFGFVIQRFGLLLRQLGVKATLIFSLHFSTVIGVALTMLGVLMMVAALVNFLQNRQAIDREEFYPRVSFPILLTLLTCLIGLLLVFYLAFSD
jgi:putative membrane protein